jgi:hypothetical protein
MHLETAWLTTPALLSSQCGATYGVLCDHSYAPAAGKQLSIRLGATGNDSGSAGRARTEAFYVAKGHFNGANP